MNKPQLHLPPRRPKTPRVTFLQSKLPGETRPLANRSRLPAFRRKKAVTDSVFARSKEVHRRKAQTEWEAASVLSSRGSHLRKVSRG